jgi:hypothetical protein
LCACKDEWCFESLDCVQTVPDDFRVDWSPWDALTLEYGSPVMRKDELPAARVGWNPPVVSHVGRMNLHGASRSADAPARCGPGMRPAPYRLLLSAPLALLDWLHLPTCWTELRRREGSCSVLPCC